MASSDAGLSALRGALLEGQAIPAHPLALTAARTSGRAQAGGTDAVLLRRGRRRHCRWRAHDTVRDPRSDRSASSRRSWSWRSRTVRDWCRDRRPRPVMIAGVCGQTAPGRGGSGARAVALGYDAALLSLAALRDASNDVLIEHCRARGRGDPADRASTFSPRWAGGCWIGPSGAAFSRSSASWRSRSRPSTATALSMWSRH